MGSFTANQREGDRLSILACNRFSFDYNTGEQSELQLESRTSESQPSDLFGRRSCVWWILLTPREGSTCESLGTINVEQTVLMHQSISYKSYYQPWLEQQQQNPSFQQGVLFVEDNPPASPPPLPRLASSFQLQHPKGERSFTHNCKKVAGSQTINDSNFHAKSDQ